MLTLVLEPAWSRMPRSPAAEGAPGAGPYARGMATLILLRHGRTSANASGTLAGRTPGVHLDDVGQGQAAKAGDRLAVVPLAELVSSPLERCRETARAVASGQVTRPRVRADKALTECDYG